MNMPIFDMWPGTLRNWFIPFVLVFGLVFQGCGEDSVYRYDVNPVDVLNPAAGKTKEKSLDQYISVLYANLFQKALSADEMIEIRKIMESIGDKELAKELIIQNLLNKPEVILPTDEEMRADLDLFLTDTYQRFFVRDPSEAEKAWMKSFITSTPDISPDLVFFSFALSEEYQFY